CIGQASCHTLSRQGATSRVGSAARLDASLGSPAMGRCLVRIGTFTCMALVAVPFMAAPAHAAPAPGAYDLAAIGASVSARVGSVVTIRVGIRNLGPNAAPPHAGVMTPWFGFGVRLPQGTTLVGKPSGCGASNFPATPPAIGCSAFGGLAAGHSLTIRIDLKVVSLHGRATGSVSTFFMPGGFTGTRPTDPDTNAANNAAAIVITPVT